MTAQENADREQKIRQVADKILQLAYDGLLINMRFLDVALSRLPVFPDGSAITETGKAVKYMRTASAAASKRIIRFFIIRLLLWQLWNCPFICGPRAFYDSKLYLPPEQPPAPPRKSGRYKEPYLQRKAPARY